MNEMTEVLELRRALTRAQEYANQAQERERALKEDLRKARLATAVWREQVEGGRGCSEDLATRQGFAEAVVMLADWRNDVVAAMCLWQRYCEQLGVNVDGWLSGQETLAFVGMMGPQYVERVREIMLLQQWPEQQCHRCGSTPCCISDFNWDRRRWWCQGCDLSWYGSLRAEMRLSQTIQQRLEAVRLAAGGGDL